MSRGAMGRRLGIVVLAAGGCFLSTGSHVATADTLPGAIGVRLVDGGPGSDARSQVYIVATVAPGASLDRRIALSNGTAGPASIAAYPAGARVDGDQFVSDDNAGPLAEWTTVTPGSVDVPSGQEAVVKVRVAVPAGASSGPRYGVVWAQPDATTSADGVTTVNRVGVRMYVTVAGGSGAGGLALSGVGLGLVIAALVLVAVGAGALLVRRRMDHAPHLTG